jgi:hypothetical protein
MAARQRPQPRSHGDTEERETEHRNRLAVVRLGTGLVYGSLLSTGFYVITCRRPRDEARQGRQICTFCSNDEI